MSPTVAVLDYGSGNLRSAVRAVEKAGGSVVLTDQAAIALEADGLLVPGVGAFAACMTGLDQVGGAEIIRHRLNAGRPVLGICVGMQILFTDGIEHGVHTAGVASLPGRVDRIEASIVPHMGWNTVNSPEGSAMFDGIEAERFYFVHSYAVRQDDADSSELISDPRYSVTWVDYDTDRFVAAIEAGPLWATQFHPEKSGEAGLRLLANWIGTLPTATGSIDRGSSDPEAFGAPNR